MPRQQIPVAVLDTSILLRLGLIQFLLGVAATGIYLPRWSEAIYAEFLEKVPERRPQPILEKLIDALAGVPDAVLPVTSIDEDAAIGGCDPGDRHVLAAALAARRLVEEDPQRWSESRVLLATGDQSDFDADFASERGVEIVGPDDLGIALLEAKPAAVLRTVQREPPARYQQYLEKMRGDGMSATANEIDRLFKELL